VPKPLTVPGCVCLHCDNMTSQVMSRRVITPTSLKGVGSTSGDFITSRLSKVVNHPSRNRLVLAAYIEHCTEPAAAAATGASRVDLLKDSSSSNEDGGGGEQQQQQRQQRQQQQHDCQSEAAAAAAAAAAARCPQQGAAQAGSRLLSSSSSSNMASPAPLPPTLVGQLEEVLGTESDAEDEQAPGSATELDEQPCEEGEDGEEERRRGRRG